MDRSFVELNRASTKRIRSMIASLSDEEMQTRVGEHWTVAIVFAHLAFWDRRTIYLLDMTERDGKLFIPEIDIFVNDLSLPLWAAIPPRQAAKICIESAEMLDARLENYPPKLLDEIHAYNKRWVVRALHRGEHLDEAEAALKSKRCPALSGRNMRSEQEMLDLILETARKDERIRAVVMNGSRANPNARRDRFQDFDIVYFVTDVTPFKYNYEWLERFGEIMIMQMPEDIQDPPPTLDGSFVYLMQFTDGNRIDLGIDPLTLIDKIVADSLSIVLLDKDGRIPALPASNEGDYLPKPPTAKAFADCCNEFWWVSAYVAKGLWRREILNAKYFLDHFVRDELMKMIDWYIGLKTQFSRNPGKYGKYVQQYLDPEQWELLQKTYSDAGYENTWEALTATCALFRQISLKIAGQSGFDYRYEEDERVSAHLEHVRQLPGDAQEIY